MATNTEVAIQRIKSSAAYEQCTLAVAHLSKVPLRTWVGIGVAVLAGIYKTAAKRYVAPNTVLEIDLRHAEFKETESMAGGLMSLFPEQGICVATLVRTINRAAKDSRISGLVVTMDRFKAQMTQIGEIREAVLAFRAEGKKTLLHTNTFVEAGSATYYYWFASAFEEIYMPTIGTMNFVGLKVQTPFLRQMLDKIGAEPLLSARRKYKTMANMFMEEKYTKEHKETAEHIINTIYEQMINDIASSRSMSVDDVRRILTDGPYSAERAHELKLINGVMYEDEFYDVLLPSKFPSSPSILQKIASLILNPAGSIAATSPGVPKNLNLLFASHFYKRTGGSPYKGKCSKAKVALINIIGSIHMGESQVEWDGTPISAGAETVVLALRQAIADKKVKAILIRVASGGGSAVASDMIAQQVAAAKSAGKKVIVSMSQYAASGGYYVSCYADKIVACPLTLTGSIGVVAGKVNLKQTWGKVGITFDSVQTSPNADLLDPLSSYDAENKVKLEAWIDDLYEKFKGHVAAGRKLSDETVEALAQGQVWMGTTALQKGLVDVLGGYETAIQVLKTELGLKEKENIQLVTFPRQLSLLESLKPVRNTRELPRSAATAHSWFSLIAPSGALNTLSTIALAWRTMSSISQGISPELKSFLNHSNRGADLSNFPNEISFSPSFDADLSIDM